MNTTVDYVVKSLEPFTPAVAKDAAGFAVRTAETVAKSAYETGESVAKSAYETGESVAKSAYEKGSAATGFASQKVSEAVEMGKRSLATITPDPVMQLLNASMEKAAAVRADPVGTVKPYVPEFVIQVGEKTYEVVAETADSAAKTVGETRGFIVTKVNGSVDYITHIPQVESLIAELKKVIPRKEGVKSEE
ncbi:MAG: hypothetical protein SGCHY_000976 [Lobulomycetales sp.]